MQIKILFDNLALDNRFLTGWGLSYLIDGKILFDTGEKSNLLLKNIKTMGIEIPNIKTVVISHDHWDHTGGLWSILKENPKLKIYACPNFNKRFKESVKSYGSQLVEVGNFTQISEDIYTTGEIEGTYSGNYMPEQSLVLRTNKGIIILTGCAHPGIIKIIDNVKQNISGNIYMVLGGFHLADKHEDAIKPIVDKFKQLNIEKVAPSHCSGENAARLFREEYGDNFIEIKIGQTIDV